MAQRIGDDGDPHHTAEACMRKFSERCDRDPGDEDDLGSSIGREIHRAVAAAIEPGRMPDPEWLPIGRAPTDVQACIEAIRRMADEQLMRLALPSQLMLHTEPSAASTFRDIERSRFHVYVDVDRTRVTVIE